MGPYALIPEQSLLGLIPMVVYVVLAFMPRISSIAAVFLACAAGFFLTGQTPAMFGSLMAESMGSTLGLIGLIIMLGAGLGQLMTETGVSQTLVYWVINGIGVKTQKRAILALMAVTTLVCGLLGTLAGGCAIIAPIMIPVVAAAGIKPSTVGAVFQSSAETGIIWGPFSGPTVALLALTGLSYGRMMLWAALPYGLIWLVVIYFVALHIQKNPKYDETYELSELEKNQVEITPVMRRTTIAFLAVFLLLVIYSLISKQGTAYTVFVMVILMLVISVFSGTALGNSLKHFTDGMATMAETFLMFLLLNVLMEYVNYGGGFDALAQLFLDMIGEGSRALVVVFGTLVGSFGINGGAVAQLQVTHDLFKAALAATKVPMEVWAIALICGSRVTSSIYPGSNMLVPMGLARSKSLKAMLLGGWAVSMVSIVFIIIWAYVGMPLFFPV